MELKRFLEDMLQEGKELVSKGAGMADRGAEMAVDQLGVEAGDGNRDLYKNIAKGVAGAGALALIFGTKGGGALARLGGLAAVGAMAYGAYQRQAGADAEADGASIEAAEGPEAERRSKTLLRAMIFAARADGEIDAEERNVIDAQMAQLDPAAKAEMVDALMAAVDAVALAGEARSPQEAREIYAMAATVTSGASEDERRFLSELAQALQLGPGLAAEIERAARV